jgi:cytochrome bd-type quinol oxidase subunit 2
MSSILIAVSVLVIFNLIATAFVLRHNALSRFQQAIQVLVVWLLPVIGGVVCLAFTRSQANQDPLSDADKRAFADSAWADGNTSGTPGICGCGAPGGDGGGD